MCVWYVGGGYVGVSLLPVGVAEATAEPGLNESCTLKIELFHI